MVVYRLASRRHPINNSEGARLFGGRWNHIGTPVIYTSAARSLAALEVIAHHGAIPSDYLMVRIDVPDGLAVESIALEDLPDGWPEGDTEAETADYGTERAASQRTAVLKVPSATMRTEYNYILNPAHPDFEAIMFELAVGEHIDHRLRKP